MPAADATVHFVVDAASTAGFQPALDALTPEFTVEQSAARRIVRTWLDTDDWRIHHAGMVLEQNTSAVDGIRLVLGSAEGRSQTPIVNSIEWPALIGSLPQGGVRSHVEGIVGIRALLPTATLRTQHRDLQVMNGDRKTVVRLTIESSASFDGTKLPAQLSVSAVRGYQDQADRVTARLVTVPGIARDSSSMYERALLAAGRAFGDDAQQPVDMSASMPASNAIVAVLQGFLSTVERTLDGVVADIDTEFLHDFRVAVRRSRSTLKLTGDVLESGAADQLGCDLKWIGDLTSPTRDLDVYLLGLPDMAAGLQSTGPFDLDPFRDYLRSRRRTEFRRLVRALRSARFGSALDHWRSLGVAAEPPDTGQVMTVGELATDRVARAHRRATKRGKVIGGDSPPEDLHDLRKRCKELRYLLEIFRPLHRPKIHRAALKGLKALQEVLGEFQDASVQGAAVREFAATMLADSSAPAPTVLAMGELAAQLTAHQHHARAEFASSFATFDSAQSKRRFRELMGGDS